MFIFNQNKRYKVLNLTLGKYIILPINLNVNRDKEEIWIWKPCKPADTPEKLISIWNSSPSRLANNIHFPCTLEEFEFIEVDDFN